MTTKKRSHDTKRAETTGLPRALLQHNWGTRPDPFNVYPFTGDMFGVPTSRIRERVLEDLSELAARAYHLSVNRWEGEPQYQEVLLPMHTAKTLREGRTQVEHLKHSPDPMQRRQGDELCRRLVESDLKEAKDATAALALAGQQAARLLEHLENPRPELLREVAPMFNTWPVNLGQTKPKQGGRQDLTRAETVKSYLHRIGLNSGQYWPETENPATDTTSPFRVAAETLYSALRHTRRQPWMSFTQRKRKGARHVEHEISTWGEMLLSLSEPMTATNSQDWWRVAKTWLDEDWRLNPGDFKVLRDSCKSGGHPLSEGGRHEQYASEVRRTVIDVRFKEAFEALAQRADL